MFSWESFHISWSHLYVTIAVASYGDECLNGYAS
jgi:hypothetical protein